MLKQQINKLQKIKKFNVGLFVLVFLLNIIFVSSTANALGVKIPEIRVRSNYDTHCADFGKSSIACSGTWIETLDTAIAAPDDEIEVDVFMYKYNNEYNMWEKIYEDSNGFANELYDEGTYRLGFEIRYWGVGELTKETVLHDISNPGVDFKFDDSVARTRYKNNEYYAYVAKDSTDYSSVTLFSEPYIVTKSADAEPLDYLSPELSIEHPMPGLNVKVKDVINDTFMCFNDKSCGFFYIVGVDKLNNMKVYDYYNQPNETDVFEKGYMYQISAEIYNNYYHMTENPKLFINGVEIEDYPDSPELSEFYVGRAYYDDALNYFAYLQILDLRYKYEFIDSNELTFTKKKSNGLSFKVDGDIDWFKTITVNGEEYVKDVDYILDFVDYELIINFTDAGRNKLNELAYGEYDIAVVFDYDEVAEGKITIESPDYLYVFLEGDNQKFNISSVSEFKIRIDGDFDLFDSLYIGDEEFVRDEDYIVSEGSTIIEFTEKGIAKLNALESGTYDIIAKYSNDKIATGSLTISAPIEVPFTFDNVVTWFALGAVSLLGIGGTVILAKKLN